MLLEANCFSIQSAKNYLNQFMFV